MKAALLALAVAVATARGQDPGATAAQQLAAQQQAIANQQDAQQSTSSDPMKVLGSAGSLPSFSVKPGSVKPGTLVRIRWRGADYAAIYYSTDGSAPTTASIPYKGPIPINSAMHVQAIGVEWNGKVSKVVEAFYNVVSATKTRQK